MFLHYYSVTSPEGFAMETDKAIRSAVSKLSSCQVGTLVALLKNTKINS